MAHDGVLTTGETAKRLDLSAERVRQLERAGVLTAMRTPRGVRFFRAVDVETLRESRRAQRRGRGRA